MGKATAEQIFRGLLHGPLRVVNGAGASLYFGRTTLASGSATQIASTTLVDSDSLVLMGLEAPGTNVASGTFKGIEVKSINPGNAIVFGTPDGIAMARDTVISWMIIKQQ